eukprot:m.595106 g.595106  ORF g.595106 m.595106 type:complete len:474 (+) comp22399_c1_seq36:115-1536(+)
MSGLRVAISGGGVCGLTLAAMLSRLPRETVASIDVYERDPREKDQGAGFDLDKTSQKALERAGIFHRYQEISRQDSSVMKFYALGQEKPLAVRATPVMLQRWIPNQPETNRHALRDALLDAIALHGHDAARVHFSTKIDSIQLQDARAWSDATAVPSAVCGKTVTANLHDDSGTSLGEFDFVVDASGISSRLRRFRIDDAIGDTEHAGMSDKYFTGISMLHGIIKDPDTSCSAAIVDKLGEGTLTVVGPYSKWFTLQRFGAATSDRRTSVYYMTPSPNPRSLADALGLPHTTKFLSDNESLRKAKTWMHHELGDSWPPEYHECVDAMTAVATRPLVKHPADPVFRNDPSDALHALPLVVIGDALHTVPPYTGAGGNLAMNDAIDVCDLVTTQAKDGISIAAMRALEVTLTARLPDVHKTAAYTEKMYAHMKTVDDVSNVGVKDLLRTNALVAGAVTLATKWYNLERRMGWRTD